MSDLDALEMDVDRLMAKIARLNERITALEKGLEPDECRWGARPRFRALENGAAWTAIRVAIHPSDEFRPLRVPHQICEDISEGDILKPVHGVQELWMRADD